ncbi:HEPN domain-containing protein [Rhizobium sp. 007]|uniref:HEPN domain-containing protein n=1 Tax=Rhizobium sp. 007 TaxID=2785056 RepID=UPI00188EC393|nr:HEPN domain-containing protein [Rhizobium sp. 007]
MIPIVHCLADVNDQLSRGRPFFTDIAKDEIVLYEEPGHPLAQPKALTPEEAKAEAQRYFDQWFASGAKFLKGAKFYLAQQDDNHASFMMHQATEHFYQCVLLVSTLYGPKSHRIKVLRSQAESTDARLVAAWPRDTRFARRCFELLSRAYVEARYSSKYTISDDELQWLVARVKDLQQLVETICKERLS